MAEFLPVSRPPHGWWEETRPTPIFSAFSRPPWIDRKNSPTPPIPAAYGREFRAVSPELKRWLLETPSSEQIRRSAAQQGPGRSPSDGRGLVVGGLQPMESTPRPPVASATGGAAAGGSFSDVFRRRVRGSLGPRRTAQAVAARIWAVVQYRGSSLASSSSLSR
jgi:hypothetical protein